MADIPTDDPPLLPPGWDWEQSEKGNAPWLNGTLCKQRKKILSVRRVLKIRRRFRRSNRPHDPARSRETILSARKNTGRPVFHLAG